MSDLIGCRLRHDDIASEDHGRPVGRKRTAFRDGSGLRATDRVGPVGQSVAARELCNPPNSPVVILADQHQCAVPRVELSTPPRRENRDDDVRHLGNFGHQPQHLQPRHVNHGGILDRPHGHRPVAAVQKRYFAHELRRPEGRREVTLIRVRIHHFDLARLDIDEPIGRFAGACEERSGRVVPLDPGCSKRRDMRGREGNALHLAEIAADRFHVQPYRMVPGEGAASIVPRHETRRPWPGGVPQCCRGKSGLEGMASPGRAGQVIEHSHEPRRVSRRPSGLSQAAEACGSAWA
ncbi:hypothetical protein MPOCJGCO_4431 [Methylobacterium trifolii]|uniref:Uncharacterized protein n=1 Tax=Methylobacterium trifolii TaxID=1003092 RepID=A0ABQ4U5H9_9HYPH|nr:hypothetical protein MPOCJGCO_4431 [Methylobacterium trifolii]